MDDPLRRRHQGHRAGNLLRGDHFPHGFADRGNDGERIVLGLAVTTLPFLGDERVAERRPAAVVQFDVGGALSSMLGQFGALGLTATDLGGAKRGGPWLR